MIRTKFYINVSGQPWGITVFLPITRYHVTEIMDTLYSIGVSEENARDALNNLTCGQLNNGITYSNAQYRESVSVWAKAVSGPAYLNLLVHELHHLSVQIADANYLDLRGEDVCYMNGDIAQHLYDIVRMLIV